MKRWILVAALSISGFGFADKPVFKLSDDAILKFKRPYVIEISDYKAATIKIDLKGMSAEAVNSRTSYPAIIKKLKELRQFAHIQKVLCFLDFNQYQSKEREIKKDEIFRFKTPDLYGTPTSTTQLGHRVTLEQLRDSKSISASFEDADDPAKPTKEIPTPRIRRLYCDFTVDSKIWYDYTFFDDFKVSHLRALFAPDLEIIEPYE